MSTSGTASSPSNSRSRTTLAAARVCPGEMAPAAAKAFSAAAGYPAPSSAEPRLERNMALVLSSCAASASGPTASSWRPRRMSR